MRKLNKKGTITLFIVFIMVAVILILIGAVVAPMGAEFSLQMFTAGQGILNDSRVNTLPLIADADIQSEINSSYVAAVDSAVGNITFATALFKYAWVIILVLLGIILFLFARRIVEYGGSYGLI